MRPGARSFRIDGVRPGTLVRAVVLPTLVLVLGAASPPDVAAIQTAHGTTLTTQERSGSHGPESPGRDQSSHQADRGVRGGPLRRVHDACAFPDGVEVPPWNWTHGDYVSSWARSSDPGPARDVAHSDCGKPMTGPRAPDGRKDGKPRRDRGKPADSASE
jgi:hypothetical protein